MKKNLYFSDSANQLLQLYLPARESFRKILQNRQAEKVTIQSSNGNITVTLLGDYKVETISISTLLFNSGKYQIENQIRDFLNVVFSETTKKHAIAINQLLVNNNLESLFMNVPAELQNAVSGFRNEYLRRVEIMEATNNEYILEKKMTIEISGGLKVFSISIDKQYLNTTEKSQLESDLQTLLQKALLEITNCILKIQMDCKQKYFNTTMRDKEEGGL
jgi:DNA-binding protein YbaB